jgi:threonyl-tRNA synthetase
MDFNHDSETKGLTNLIDQVIAGKVRETVPQRILDLCEMYGFEWEEVSEIGHMRFLPGAAFIFEQAKIHAGQIANSFCNGQGIPFFQIEGVNVVDSSSSVLKDYFDLIMNEPSIYGLAPYQIINGDHQLLLRQTGCLQKFVAGKEFSWTRGTLPVCIFEISDSYRRESVDVLQLCYRLRRFHLPEAHIHTADTKEALDLSLHLHKFILEKVESISKDYELLVSVSNNFYIAQKEYMIKLASIMDKPFLLKVYPPGQLCEDGVEVDVEYKVIDSLGCPREFSTFQIEELITKAFGMRYTDRKHVLGSPSTIHAVFTGSIERLIYFIFDGIRKREISGGAAKLPLWMTPVIARVIPLNTGSIQASLQIANHLNRCGIRSEVDDRKFNLARKLAESDAELIPYQILVNEDFGKKPLLVRGYKTEKMEHLRLSNFVSKIRKELNLHRIVEGSAPRLSRRPMNLKDGWFR